MLAGSHLASWDKVAPRVARCADGSVFLRFKSETGSIVPMADYAHELAAIELVDMKLCAPRGCARAVAAGAHSQHRNGLTAWTRERTLDEPMKVTMQDDRSSTARENRAQLCRIVEPRPSASRMRPRWMMHKDYTAERFGRA